MTFLSPPTYQEVSRHGPRVQLPTSELISLILDGRSIYPAGSALPRYELSASPRGATSSVLSIKKLRYRLSRNNGQGRLRFRLDDLYTCRDISFRIHMRRHIAINGNTRDGRTYSHVKLRPGITGWSSCSVVNNFKAARGRRGKQMTWKDDVGRIIAVEEEAMLMETGGQRSTPSLRLLEVLSDKDLDLIVTCWAARLWKEAKRQLKGRTLWARASNWKPLIASYISTPCPPYSSFPERGYSDDEFSCEALLSCRSLSGANPG